MTNTSTPPFQLPDIYLNQLPTGSVKTAVDRLGRMIATGAFAEGDTIPIEAELCKMLDVSRTVVREAIKVLSGKSVVRTARRYGTKVLPFECWNLLDPDVLLWHDPEHPSTARLHASGLQMRVIFEPEAAKLAAVNATASQRERILLAAEQLMPEPFCFESMKAADYAFHATILEASGNLMLAQLSGVILASLHVSYAKGEMALVDRATHIEIAEAIAQERPEVAGSLMFAMLSCTASAMEAVA